MNNVSSSILKRFDFRYNLIYIFLLFHTLKQVLYKKWNSFWIVPIFFILITIKRHARRFQINKNLEIGVYYIDQEFTDVTKLSGSIKQVIQKKKNLKMQSA